MYINNELSNNKKDNQIDKRISFSVLSFYLILLLQFTIRSLTGNREGTISDLIKFGAIAFQGVIYLYSFKYVLIRKWRTIIYIYLTTLIIFSINMLLFPQNLEFLLRLIFPFFATSLPAFIYVLSIKNFEEFDRIMIKIADFSFIFAIILLYSLLSGKIEDQDYSMGLSYYLLFSLIIFTKRYIEDFRIKDLIRSAIVLTFIVLFGSRGAVVCFIVYFLFKISREFKNISYKKLIILSIFLVVSIVIAFSYKDLLKVLDEYFYYNFGLRSRTIELILYDTGHLSGRYIIYEVMSNSINRNPFFGIGIVGDRTLMNNFGLYAHNIFLELFVQFGIILGGLLLVILSLFIVNALSVKNEKIYNLAIIWICIGFIPLLFSGSYLTSIEFWVMLAILLKIFRKEEIFIKGEKYERDN